MESLRFLAVMLSTILSGTLGNLYDLYLMTSLTLMCLCLYFFWPITLLGVKFMKCLVQVQWSSLRPTQLPLMCVELATSPSGVSMVVWRMC